LEGALLERALLQADPAKRQPVENRPAELVTLFDPPDRVERVPPAPLGHRYPPPIVAWRRVPLPRARRASRSYGSGCDDRANTCDSYSGARSVSMGTVNGATLVARTLVQASVGPIFTLSGNQILPIYDAGLDEGCRFIDGRHETAVAHMADAWGRL